jgi:uncharacterized protein (DUF58 family)
MGRNLLRWAAGLIAIGLAALACPVNDGAMGGAWAQDFSFSAKVDKTSVDVGEPIQLTLTLSGNVSEMTVPPIELPEGFVIAARSQATSFSIRGSAMERSTNLVYVIIPQQAGTFQLGPFTIERSKKSFETEPIAVTVKKPAVPPSLRKSPPGERFTL